DPGGPAMSRDARALVVAGAVGVGKTTVIDAIGEVLAERGVPGAAIDLDRLRRGWPAPPDDPFTNRLERTALGAVCRVHLEAGAQVIVAAGVLEGREDRPLYEVAFGCPRTVVRLTAPRWVLRVRLRRLDEGVLDSRACYLYRFDELTGIRVAAAVEAASLPILDDPLATARGVLAACGL